jgi:hypothetical protein
MPEPTIAGGAPPAVPVITEWTPLKAAAVAGELRFEPQAADACARAFEDAANNLYGYIHRAQTVTRVDGFGATIAGDALAGKFSRKGQELVDALTAHQRVFFDMAATYRAAGKAYAATEGTSTASMRGAAQ